MRSRYPQIWLLQSNQVCGEVRLQSRMLGTQPLRKRCSETCIARSDGWGRIKVVANNVTMRYVKPQYRSGAASACVHSLIVPIYHVLCNGARKRHSALLEAVGPFASPLLLPVYLHP
jgi:hypothetical protein